MHFLCFPLPNSIIHEKRGSCIQQKGNGKILTHKIVDFSVAAIQILATPGNNIAEVTMLL